MMLSQSHVTAALVAVLLSTAVPTGAREPEFKADVPESILTPDKVDVRLLGELEFFDGMPSETTVKKVFDFLDFSRGVNAFLDGIPATSVYAMLEGFKDAGLKPGDLGLMEELMDARSLMLTANSTTVYGFTEINVEDGPVVAEIPPGVLGPVDDAFFRFVTDVGLTGPDQGIRREVSLCTSGLRG